MSVIPRSMVDGLTDKVNAVSSEAQALIAATLEALDWTDVERDRRTLVDALQEVCDSYADVVAQAAADMYDDAREAVVGERLGAQALPGYEPDATDRAVRYFVKSIVDGKPVESFNAQVLGRVDYELKRAAGRCATANAARDPLKPRYARVPTGSETCPFCIMLASRGFVYRSKETAGGIDHYHPGCDCRVVCQWEASQGVEGYDVPDLFEQYLKLADTHGAEWKAASRSARGKGTAAPPRFGSIGEASKYVQGASAPDELQARLAEAYEDLERMFKGKEDAVKKARDVVAAAARRRMREITA